MLLGESNQEPGGLATSLADEFLDILRRGSRTRAPFDFRLGDLCRLSVASPVDEHDTQVSEACERQQTLEYSCTPLQSAGTYYSVDFIPADRRISGSREL